MRLLCDFGGDCPAVLLVQANETSMLDRKETVHVNPMPRRELTRRLRREFARYQFQVKVEILWQSRKVWGTVTDVSRGGLFIEMADAPCMGAHFTAHLALNEPLRLNCVVRRVVPDLGVGVALSIPEQSRKRFQALLLALSAGADPATTSVTIPRTEPPRFKAAAARA
jgi:hypothetical protein